MTSEHRIAAARERIRSAYLADAIPWIVGYSGGKDSTAVLKLTAQALSKVSTYHKPVTVVFCDTGVEVPCAAELAQRALRSFAAECAKADMPIKTIAVEPRPQDRFFVKVIGRGYPPPTDKFRWCTDRLRINPVSDLLKRRGYRKATVVVGVRADESSARNLTLAENANGDRFWRNQNGFADRCLFMPIVDLTVNEVWAVNLAEGNDCALRGPEVADLYAQASECPSERGTTGAPARPARFGCWVCTVAKHGVTLRNLISSGRMELAPLLDFRMWMEQDRSNPKFRWAKRRNGDPGPGPMTMSWRVEALERLLQAQELSGFDLIQATEIKAIHEEWEAE
jgi:DNA sulfur modification protein DndC